MECYEGAKMIKTFRGLIANGAQDTINLHTNDGSTGYRIVKFQTIGKNLTGEANESVMQIWQSEPPAALSKALVDFSSTILLGFTSIWRCLGNINVLVNYLAVEYYTLAKEGITV